MNGFDQSTKARIFQPSPSATQSGKGRSRSWQLVVEGQTSETRDPTTGWHRSGNTLKQLQLHFSTAEEAIAFARGQGLDYEVTTPQVRHPSIRRYGDHFRYRPTK